MEKESAFPTEVKLMKQEGAVLLQGNFNAKGKLCKTRQMSLNPQKSGVTYNRSKALTKPTVRVDESVVPIHSEIIGKRVRVK